jgi:hypothetical protein
VLEAFIGLPAEERKVVRPVILSFAAASKTAGSHG